ncbi:MAG: UvrD-helicase domain-containing protein [Muribaculaceae bacterium]|nr:UvrD-helicase domain-containing protein [Muribaculaceae bacterium]
MLELQRASAGSGKTFTLAKKFIWYYITIPDEAGRRRLRTPAELTDSLGHILAVTFTNKATNEMQQRIVEKLYALGYPEEGGKRPDYMAEFLNELNKHSEREIEEKDISATCRRAVGILLNNYSDFQVSTIDSFFQQVLRTFAYESDLSDSYRIELDTDYLSAMAIDALLEDINSGKDESGASFWIGELMSRAKNDGKKWNIFAKSVAGDNPYSLLTESVKRLENEEFKEIRRELDRYFSTEPDFPGIYLDMQQRYEAPVREAYQKLRRASKKMRSILASVESSLDAKDVKIFQRRFETVAGSKTFELPLNSKKERIESLEQNFPNTYHSRKKKGDISAYQTMEDADAEMAENYDEWSAKLRSEGFRHWRLYRENLPFMGLLQAIREKRDEYLRENNAIELGETNAMLHDIIGEDDAPFIYERIGTRLNHFLIDEFQDTSKMQWRNMSPLLHESVGRGNENLIIGDAKQSIYRFRNADSSLISRRVPEEFGCDPNESPATSAQNTNWRSDLRVVQFNNSFFSFLSGELNRLVGAGVSPERRDFEADYLNVVQHPHHKNESGYVEVRRGTDSDQPWNEYVLWSIPEIVEDVLSRGFRMRDIAVLVDRNSEGEDVIATLTEYNAQVPEGGRRLEYVSEQSLKLTSSAAVALVVSVLETISRGADPEVRTGEERARRGVADWSEVACNFKFFAMRHPELSTPECLAGFFEEGGDNDAIGEMLRKMQAVTLPALVESIIAEFIPADIRRTDAVFLAAFQDLVLEYCESRPSDVTSFLRWWTDKKKSASISSPEDMDAITVMTVHKSKGLEFPIVIAPFANPTFKDGSGKREWRWIRPEVVSSERGDLPPFIPIPTAPIVEGTRHEHVLNEYYDLRKMDSMNSIYVAFTRAACELYIFSKPSGKTEDPVSMSGLLGRFFNVLLESDGGMRRIEMMQPSAVGAMDNDCFTYGEKYAHRQNENKGKTGEEYVMKDYAVRTTPDFLLYRTEDVPEVVDAEDPELSEDEDPRSEGNILHEIMQGVERQADIPRAVRRMMIKGVITSAEASRYGGMLTVMTSRPEVKGWFEGDWRVVNERPLLRAGNIMKRPDRVMISPDGEAVVVDYKFGESMSTHRRYAAQVRDYVETLKDTGRFKSVTGYLWYVKLHKLELVAR